MCQTQAIDNQCCGWIGPCGSYYDGKTSFSNNYEEAVEKQGLLLTDPGNYMGYLGPRSEMGERELGRETGGRGR